MNYFAFIITRAVQDQVENLCSNSTQLEYEYGEGCQTSSDPLFNLLNELRAQQLYQDFLYPDNYHPIGTLSSEIIQRANLTSCCYDHDVAKNTALWIFNTVQSDNN